MNRLLLTLLLALASAAPAQTSFEGMDPDGLFAAARTLAFAGQRAPARVLLRIALAKAPEYADVRILLARTYAWDGMHDSARAEFRTVLYREQDNRDALHGAIDNETWAGEAQSALALCDRALQFYPKDVEFLLKKARLHFERQQDREAAAALNRIARLDRTNAAAAELRQAMALQSSLFTAGAEATNESYSRIYGPMRYATLSLGRRTPYGAVIVRANGAYRFGSGGLQAEVDWYPGLGEGMYGYLNYGYSGSTLFPTHRFGAEFFSTIPGSFEASAGVRLLDFESGDMVTMVTAAVGYYYGSFWGSLRGYLTPWEHPNGSSELSPSYSATVRWYQEGPDDFFHLRVQGGFSPDLRRLQSGAGMTGTEVFLLGSQSLTLGWQALVTDRLLLSVTADAARQELSSLPDEYVTVVSLTAGFKVRF